MRFFVAGKPTAKGRPRAGRGGRIYTPRSTREYEARVARAAASVAPGGALTAPLVVEVVAVFRRPAKLPRGPRRWRPSTPDADNIAKAVLDGMQRGGLLEDDRVVVELRVRKVYGATDEPEGVWVTVEEAGRVAA